MKSLMIVFMLILATFTNACVSVSSMGEHTLDRRNDSMGDSSTIYGRGWTAIIKFQYSPGLEFPELDFGKSVIIERCKDRNCMQAHINTIDKEKCDTLYKHITMEFERNGYLIRSFRCINPREAFNTYL